MAMVTSVFDHAWLGGFFGDPEIGALLREDAELARMVRVEAAHTKALGVAGVVSQDIAEQAAAAIRAAKIDPCKLRDGCTKDGLPVPALVREIKTQADAGLHEAIHVGLTSQDVLDTGLILLLSDLLPVYADRLETLCTSLAALDTTIGSAPLMGRTRMQAALPITVSDRIATWSNPLITHIKRIEEIRPRLLCLQFGGAVGTRSASGAKSDAIAEAFAAELRLANPPKAWHAMRDGLVEFASWLSLVTGTLGKMGQDMCLMAQQGIDEIKLKSGGGSSAMPHKHNPVQAELLVTLAQFNATQISGMHTALVHEQERSGSAWSLEWMILPQMLMTTGRSLLVADELLNVVEKIGAGSPTEK